MPLGNPPTSQRSGVKAGQSNQTKHRNENHTSKGLEQFNRNVKSILRYST